MKTRPLVQHSLLCAAFVASASWVLRKNDDGLPPPRNLEAGAPSPAAAESAKPQLSAIPEAPDASATVAVTVPAVEQAPSVSKAAAPLPVEVPAALGANTLPAAPPQPALADIPLPPPPLLETPRPVDPLASIPIPPNCSGHLILLGAGKTVRLRGEVRTAEMRDRLIDKAKRQYPDREIKADLRVAESLLKPFEGLDLTLRSFPTLPQPESPGIMGMAVVGQPWRHISIPTSGVESATVPSLPLFPDNYDATRALVDFDSVLSALKAHVGSLSLPKTAFTKP